MDLGARGAVVGRRATRRRGRHGYCRVVSHRETTGRPPLGPDPCPTKALQAAGLVVDQSGPYAGAEAALVRPALAPGRNVCGSAGASGDGNAAPMA